MNEVSKKESVKVFLKLASYDKNLTGLCTSNSTSNSTPYSTSID